MRMIAILTFMLALGTVANANLAYAQETAPTASPAVREEFSAWLNDAAAFRDGAQETAQLWQRDNAPLLDVRTDIFMDEAETFVETTQTYVRHLNNLASGSETASLLRDISDSVSARINALAEARPQGAAAVVRELNAMDRALYERFLTFGVAEQFQARPTAPIRVTYVTASAE